MPLLRAPEEDAPDLVLRAVLALDFMAFSEFAFGVVRPNTPFKPNWHLEALAQKLSQVACGRGQAAHYHHAAAQSEIAVGFGRSAGVVPRSQPLRTHRRRILFGPARPHARQ